MLLKTSVLNTSNLNCNLIISSSQHRHALNINNVLSRFPLACFRLPLSNVVVICFLFYLFVLKLSEVVM